LGFGSLGFYGVRMGSGDGEYLLVEFIGHKIGKNRGGKAIKIKCVLVTTSENYFVSYSDNEQQKP
jgi:hypothetical protein